MTARKSLLLLSLTCLLTGGPSLTAEPSSGHVIDLDSPSQVVARQGGEIRWVMQDAVVVKGEPRQLSLAFANESDMNKILASGIETLDLSRLDTLHFLNERGEFVERVDPKVSLLDVGHIDHGTLCSDVIARGSKQVAEGLWVGISVHVGHGRRLGGTITDVFDDCDVFAWGGCGGPYCINLHSDGQGIETEGGRCEEREVWGPNTCRCKRL